MGRETFPFMRYYSLVIALLLIGCYTDRLTEKKVRKAFKKNPIATSKVVSDLFPIKSDSTAYVQWKKEIDSIFKIYDSLSNIPDTIINRINIVPSGKSTGISKKEIEVILRDKLMNIPYVNRVDSSLIYSLNARIDKIEDERDKYKGRWRTFFEISLCILILLLLVLYLKK